MFDTGWNLANVALGSILTNHMVQQLKNHARFVVLLIVVAAVIIWLMMLMLMTAPMMMMIMNDKNATNVNHFLIGSVSNEQSHVFHVNLLFM